MEYGGLGLDYSYQAIAAEALAQIDSGGVIMGIGVQCDITTTALSNHGSHELKQKFLAPTIAGQHVFCSLLISRTELVFPVCLILGQQCRIVGIIFSVRRHEWDESSSQFFSKHFNMCVARALTISKLHVRRAYEKCMIPSRE